MIKAFLYKNNDIEFEIKTLLYCNGHRFKSKKGLFDYLTDIGFDLSNTDKYIYKSFADIVNDIFDLSKDKTVVKTKLKGNFEDYKTEYENNFGIFVGDRFEINIEELKKLINDI